MDKVIKEMEENKNIIIDGKFVYELEQQLKRLQAEYDDLHLSYAGCKTANTGLQELNQKLEQENERMKEEIKQYKKYKFLFEKAKEFKEKTDKWASKCLAENEDLKDTIKRTVCQSECFRYKQANNYKQTLQEIRELIKKLDLSLGCAYGDYDCDNCSDINEETVCKIKLQNYILAKINEVIGAE